MRAVPGSVGYPSRYECTGWALEAKGLLAPDRLLVFVCVWVRRCLQRSERCDRHARVAPHAIVRCIQHQEAPPVARTRIIRFHGGLRAARVCAQSAARASLWQAHQRQAARQGMASNGGTHASEWSVSGWNINTLSVRCFSHDSSSSLTAGRAARNSGPSSAVERRRVHSRTRLFGASDGRQPW
jgi:hypothetical protein